MSSTTLIPNNQVTIFLVGKFNGDKSGNKTFFGFTEAAVASRISFEALDITGTTGFRFWYGTSGFIDSTQSIANNFIISAVKDSNTQYLYMNGALSVSGANAQSLTSFSNQLTVGGYRPQASALAAKSYIGEVIMFNRALSDFERQQIEQYLSKKWGIKLA